VVAVRGLANRTNRKTGRSEDLPRTATGKQHIAHGSVPQSVRGSCIFVMGRQTQAALMNDALEL
jgi:hypothetical protein